MNETCRNYIKDSFATSGPGALNIWPSRQDPDGGWLEFYDSKGFWTTRTTVTLTYGSTALSCNGTGTNPIVPSPTGTYDASFDTSGYWLSAGPVPDKLFGQMFGFGALYTWPAVRMQ